MALEKLTPAVCVIGAGIGGVEAALAAARNGLETVLIERAGIGGQSLHVGCVPSKALIASAQRAFDMRSTRELGISPAVPLVDHTAINRHLEAAIRSMAQNLTPQRFEGLGIRFIASPARFVDDQTVEAGDYTIVADHYIIATGSYPMVPAIDGLNGVPFLTTDTVFDVTNRMESLTILGGTFYAAELAQAYARLGSPVTLITPGAFLHDHDIEATAVLREALTDESIAIVEGAEIEHIERAPNLGVKVIVREASGPAEYEASELLLAVGRRPNVDSLDLDRANVDYDSTGIRIGKFMQTSNKRVFAIGDVAACAHDPAAPADPTAGCAIAQARALVSRLVSHVGAEFIEHAIPRVVRTDPEIAQIGLTEDRAREQFNTIEVRRYPFAENAFAQLTRRPEGFIKVIVRSSGRIVGCTAVGHRAGEVIAPWALAMNSNLTVEAVSGAPMAYPDRNQVTIDVANTLTSGSARNPWLRKTLNKLPGVR